MERIYLPSMEDCKNVLETLQEIIVKYGIATVEDYYNIVGFPSTYLHTKLGWLMLINVKILQDGPNRWYLDLPGPGHITMRFPESVKEAHPATEFRDELTTLINKHSRENRSNTPDYLLAEFLVDALNAFDKVVTMREVWYGRDSVTLEVKE